MLATDDDLEVKDARRDKTVRRGLALLMAVAMVPAVYVLVRGTADGSMVLLSLGVALAAIAVAWRGGMVARGRALLQLRAFSRAGLVATRLLNCGDIEGAQRGYVALLKKARPLGAFHAAHVLMYGVTRFLQGETEEGLRLVTRVVDSGWFAGTRGRAFRDSAETWRVLMLLTLGQTAEARRRVEASPDARLASARVALAIAEAQWQSAIDTAKQGLAADDLVKAGRPTLAALGRHAARKLEREDEVAAFEKVLAAEPLGALAKATPAFRGLLD